jgi:hypothetical protein
MQRENKASPRLYGILSSLMLLDCVMAAPSSLFDTPLHGSVRLFRGWDSYGEGRVCPVWADADDLKALCWQMSSGRMGPQVGAFTEPTRGARRGMDRVTSLRVL